MKDDHAAREVSVCRARRISLRAVMRNKRDSDELILHAECPQWATRNQRTEQSVCRQFPYYRAVGRAQAFEWIKEKMIQFPKRG